MKSNDFCIWLSGYLDGKTVVTPGDISYLQAKLATVCDIPKPTEVFPPIMPYQITSGYVDAVSRTELQSTTTNQDSPHRVLHENIKMLYDLSIV